MPDEKFIFSVTLHHDQETGEYVLRAVAYEGTQSEERFDSIDQAMEQATKAMSVVAAENKTGLN